MLAPLVGSDSEDSDYEDEDVEDEDDEDEDEGDVDDGEDADMDGGGGGGGGGGASGLGGNGGDHSDANGDGDDEGGEGGEGAEEAMDEGERVDDEGAMGDGGDDGEGAGLRRSVRQHEMGAELRQGMAAFTDKAAAAALASGKFPGHTLKQFADASRLEGRVVRSDDGILVVADKYKDSAQRASDGIREMQAGLREEAQVIKGHTELSGNLQGEFSCRSVKSLLSSVDQWSPPTHSLSLYSLSTVCLFFLQP